MNIEPLAAEHGLNRLRIEGQACFRIKDVTDQAHGYDGSLGGAAAKMYVEATGRDGFMVHAASARGRYLPESELPAVVAFLNDPDTQREARRRVFGGIAKRKQEITKAMTPIELKKAVDAREGEVWVASAVDLRTPIHYIITAEGLYFKVNDLVHAVTNAKDAACVRTFLALHPTKTIFVSIPRANTGRPAIYVRDDLVDDMLARLSKRKDYDKDLSKRLLRRLTEFRTKLGPAITDKALAAAEPAPAAPPFATMAQQVAQAAIPFPDLPLPPSSSQQSEPDEADKSSRKNYATRVMPEIADDILALTKGLRLHSQGEVVERAISALKGHTIAHTRAIQGFGPDVSDEDVLAKAYKADGAEPKEVSHAPVERPKTQQLMDMVRETREAALETREIRQVEILTLTNLVAGAEDVLERSDDAIERLTTLAATAAGRLADEGKRIQGVIELAEAAYKMIEGRDAQIDRLQEIINQQISDTDHLVALLKASSTLVQQKDAQIARMERVLFPIEAGAAPVMNGQH